MSRTRCSVQRCSAEPGPTSSPGLGPGSAAHHSAGAPCCAAHGTRCWSWPRVLAARFARALQIRCASSKKRAQGMPGARCTRGLVCRNCALRRTRAYRAAETLRHPLRNGFTAYFVLSPVSGLFCHRHLAKNFPQGLAPASRRQDHTTSPYALAFSSGAKNTPDVKASTAFRPNAS